MSSAQLLGMMMASLPDSGLVKLEGRGEGTVAVLEAEGRTWRVQVDELNQRAEDAQPC